MSRNRELRKRIVSQDEVVRDHEQKIRQERMKPQPDEGVIRTWQREIAAARKKVDSLTRRLKREW